MKRKNRNSNHTRKHQPANLKTSYYCKKSSAELNKHNMILCMYVKHNEHFLLTICKSFYDKGLAGKPMSNFIKSVYFNLIFRFATRMRITISVILRLVVSQGYYLFSVFVLFFVFLFVVIFFCMYKCLHTL